MEVARRRLDAGLALQIGNEDAARLTAKPLARIRTAAMRDLIAAPMGQRKPVLALANAAQQLGEIMQFLDDQMDDLALALDAAFDRNHPRREDDAAIALVDFRPDHEIGDAGLVLDGDEDDAAGCAGPLAYENEPRCAGPTPIARADRRGAGDDLLDGEIRAQEGDGMAAQGEARRGIILDDFPACRHRPQRHDGLDKLGQGFLWAGCGSEKR